MSPRRDVSMSAAEVTSFLAIPRTGVLTTLDRTGWPHSVAMWFVPGEEGLRMWTYARSQKVRNIERDPRCAFLVEAGAGYGDLQGVLIRAEAELVTRTADVRAIGIDLYKRYTEPGLGIPVEEGPIEEIDRQTPKRVGLLLSPASVASWDHSKL